MPLTLWGHPWPEPAVLGLTLSRDGRTLVSVGQTGIGRLWNLATGKDRIVLELNETLSSAVETPDGQALLLVSSAGRVWEMDLATGKHFFLHSVPAPVRNAALAPDGKLLIVGLREQYFLDRSTGVSEPVSALTGLIVGRAVFSPAGKLYTLDGPEVYCPQGILRCTDLRRRQTTVLVEERSISGQILVCSWDRRWVAGTVRRAQGKDAVFLWDIHADRLHQPILEAGGAVGAVAFAPDSRALAAAVMGASPGVKVWTLPEGRELGTLGWHPGSATQMAFTPDGNILAVSSSDGSIRLLPWKQLLGEGSC